MTRQRGFRATAPPTGVAPCPDRVGSTAPVFLLSFLLLRPSRASAATCVSASALYDPTYATQAAGKTAAEVRAWVHGRASVNHVPVTYARAYDALESIDAHNSTHVRVIYGGFEKKCRSVGGCAWNREHLWPQSYGVGESSGLPSSATPRSDLHALVPSRIALNSARGNRAFSQVIEDGGGTSSASCAPGYEGCESPVCTPSTCSAPGAAQQGANFWTPPPRYRGFVARALFYMDVRYDGAEVNTRDLRLGDVLDRDTYTFGMLSHLLRWHEEYPVMAWERARNEAVCAEQGNRNPFVDKPGLVAVVFNDSRTATDKVPPPAASPTGMPWINELHYDNAGNDAAEFLEVVLPLDGPLASTVSITLYNGNDGAPYWGPVHLNEPPFVKGATESFPLVNGSTSGGVTFYSASILGIQNGPADGVALSVAGSNGGAAIQFLSYEGTINVAVGGVANGMSSTDIRVADSSATAKGTSLSLSGRGSAYTDFLWSSGVAATPGALNVGQTVVAPPAGTYAVMVSSRSSGKSASGGAFTFAVAAALVVMWVFYIVGMFRYFI